MNKLTEKLQLKPNTKWLLFNAPVNYLSLIEPLDNVDIQFEAKGVFNGIQLFVKDKAELASSLKLILTLLKPETIFWISYPKKSAIINSDIDKTSIWNELQKNGLQIVTSISIDKTWTAFRFKPVGLVKLSASRNANIRQNEYSEYIDVDNKQITLPADVADLLQQNLPAMAFYQSLSYSNKKEYVVWILSAKQEKTREDRLNKMMEKLSAGKKNLAEK